MSDGGVFGAGFAGPEFPFPRTALDRKICFIGMNFPYHQ